MATTVTIVDPFKGTLVIESNRNVEVFIGSTTSVKIDGDEVESQPAAEAIDEPGPAAPIIRTPPPEDQSMTVTEQPEDGEAQELPQGGVGAPESPQDEPKPEKAEEYHEQPSELKLDGPAPRKQATKKCAYCGDDYQGANRSMYCPRHKDPSSRPARQIPAKVKAADPSGKPTADSPLPEGMWWCVHHKSQQPHRSPDCPLITDNPEKRATDQQATDFTDPWDCGRCRTDGQVCRFHRSMEASGNKPPKK